MRAQDQRHASEKDNNAGTREELDQRDASASQNTRSSGPVLHRAKYATGSEGQNNNSGIVTH